jgi:hypothetical protein
LIAQASLWRDVPVLRVPRSVIVPPLGQDKQDKKSDPPRNVLPVPEPPFQGKIGRTVKDSTPDFPKEVQAPKGGAERAADPDR